jgi:sterol desaturase/sphingolipid hydroxylase (fatty acid hydroxylase superfamily)
VYLALESILPGRMKRKELFKSNKNISPPMFQNRFVDYFSRVHFTTPLVIYVPVVGYLVYHGIWVMEASLLSFWGLFATGLLAWTFFEYTLHRWVFHWIPDRPWGEQFHFWLHGVHHDYPNDSKRLVMPPGFSLPLAVLVGSGLYFTVGPVYWSAVFGGFALGYLCYDMLHFAVHHLKWKNKWFMRVQKHHMHHHFKDPESGFGFTSKFWDWVFGTRMEDGNQR